MPVKYGYCTRCINMIATVGWKLIKIVWSTFVYLQEFQKTIRGDKTTLGCDNKRL